MQQLEVLRIGPGRKQLQWVSKGKMGYFWEALLPERAVPNLLGFCD